VISESSTFPNTPQEPIAASDKRPWPLAVWIIPDGLIALLLTFLFSVVVLIGYLLYQAVTGASLRNLLGQNGVTLPSGLLFGLLLAQNLAFVGVVLLRTRVIRRLPLRWVGLTLARPLQLIGWGVGFGILFVALNFVIGQVFGYFGIESDQADLFPLKQGDTIGQILIFLGATVAAPIGEEMFFRGYIFKALRENSSRHTIGVIALELLLLLGLPILAVVLLGVFTWGDVALLMVSLTTAFVVAALVPSMRVRAYLISATFFAVIHLGGITQGASVLLAATFIGGLCLAGAFDRTQSLVPSIIAHAINNSVAFGQLVYCVNTYGSVQNCG
jgi:membrane protease YdiL (CAAX protease family)